MFDKDNLLKWFISRKPVDWVIQVSKKIVLPGFEGLPLYNIAGVFFRGLSEGYIATRAAAISFSVFLAIFPFLIFLFNIIPFIPVKDFQPQLLEIIRDFLPNMAYETVKETIFDIVTRPRSSILILNLLLTLYFSTNGVNSLLEAFSNTYHNIVERPWWKQYVISIMIVLVNSLLLIISIGLMTFGSTLILWILPDFIKNSISLFFLLQVLRWLIILALLLSAISFVYYFAPVRRPRFRYFSPGASFATMLIIITTLGFNYYVDHFSTYNALYGSLGTLMIVLFWIYINAISLLLGFELDASISSAEK